MKIAYDVDSGLGRIAYSLFNEGLALEPDSLQFSQIAPN
jgi:hypothetical protein